MKTNNFENALITTERKEPEEYYHTHDEVLLANTLEIVSNHTLFSLFAKILSEQSEERF
jgi:hypothetical protein